jgi:hypothetical protein
MFRFFLPGVMALLLFASCTMILSTNYPGSSEKSMPDEWLGRYEVNSPSLFPEKKDSAKTEKKYASIENNRISWTTNDENKIYTLGDSLSYSTYDQNRYISFLMPQGLYAVFKVIKNGATLELYSMSSEEEPKKTELNKYFDKVEKKSEDGDDYYKVTIIDKKLDAFFKSPVPSKEPIKLIPLN